MVEMAELNLLRFVSSVCVCCVANSWNLRREVRKVVLPLPSLPFPSSPPPFLYPFLFPSPRLPLVGPLNTASGSN